MGTLLALIVGVLLLYIAWLHIQLYISRRVIATLRQTTVTIAQKRPSLDPRPILAGLGGLIMLAWLITALWSA
ncbi:MAG TPA: hypothetical protein PK954_15785 [Anaerolineales bacterium]|nr:hypothetical protein [Anaerolineales bacterium]HRF46244.1 hypothetical protein [Anaerolineales bacterium]